MTFYIVTRIRYLLFSLPHFCVDISSSPGFWHNSVNDRKIWFLRTHMVSFCFLWDYWIVMIFIGCNVYSWHDLFSSDVLLGAVVTVSQRGSGSHYSCGSWWIRGYLLCSAFPLYGKSHSFSVSQTEQLSKVRGLLFEIALSLMI